MNYLFAINTMNVGGAETGLVELMNDLSKDNSITLFLTYKKGDLLNEINENIKVISLVDKKKPLKSILGLICFCATLLGSTLGYKLFIKEKYDFEIAYLEGFPSLFISQSKSNSIKIASVRVELDGHETILDILPWGRKLQIKMYSRFEGIHCVSYSTQSSFNKKYPMAASKTYVINTGFDKKSIIEKADMGNPFSNKGINVVSVGRIESQKGYDKLFEAVSNLNNKGKLEDIKFHIIGNSETEYSKKLNLQYSNLIDQNIIVLHGQKSNPYNFIKHADVILTTSNREGFPRVINEALILKKYIVATDIPSNREIIENDEIGILVENSVLGVENGIMFIQRNIEFIHSPKESTRDISTLSQYKEKFVNKLMLFRKLEENS